jgi:signal transduction histidine kinase
MRVPLLLLLSAAFVSECLGQGSPIQFPPIKLSQIGNHTKLDSVMMIYFDKSWSDDFRNVPFEAYSPPPQPMGGDWWYGSYFHFDVYNDTGKNYNGVIYVAGTGENRLARVNSKGVVMQSFEPLVYNGPWLFNEEYFQLSIPADSTWHLVIRSESQLSFRHVSVWIMNAREITTFMKVYSSQFFDMTFFHCIVGGMLFMMLLYVLTQFALFRTREYGYYAAYIFVMLLFLLENAFEVFELDVIRNTGERYALINEHLQIIAYCFYFAFLSSYTNARSSDKLLYRLVKICVILLIAYMVIDDLRILVGLRIHWIYPDMFQFTILRCVLALFVVFLAVRVWNLKQPYARYPIYGGVLFMIVALASFACALHREWRIVTPWPFGYEMFYYFVGVLIEITFFSLGLAHKRRQDAIEKIEAQDALKLEVERQQVRHLNALSEAQESERSRFAKDLHDGLGGMLSGVKLSLSNMKGNAMLSGQYVDVFERALDMLDNSIHELRRVAHNLMPESLVKFGLAASLKDFCDFINSSKVINVIFQQIGTYHRLEMSAEIVLYRVINELVNNALRHASATELIIQLNYDDHLLTLTVEDNGKGFDPSTLDQTTGSGWPNIKSRIAYLKGSLDVQASPGNGTSVNITIPI